ncbi:MAG TPA: hypothetical protein DCS93_44685 [Microscillaceae bacterium]|nr:hypothetical protein [Microscillaceae bacterium]
MQYFNKMALMAFIIIFMANCQSKSPKDILTSKKWHPSVESFIKASGKTVEETSDKDKAKLKDIVKDFAQEFKTDGTYLLGVIDNSKKGSWSLSADNKTLTTKYRTTRWVPGKDPKKLIPKEGEEKELKFTVQSISSSKILLAPQNGPTKAVMELIPFK